MGRAARDTGSVMGTHGQEDAAPQAGPAGKFLERTRLPAPCPLCSTRTRPGLQEPQEVSLLSPFRPEPGQAHQVEMGPHVHAGLHGAPQHHATLPMDGVGPAGALCLRESLQPKLTLAEAEQLPPGRAQPPLYASHTPGLGVFRGLGHGVGQGPG